MERAVVPLGGGKGAGLPALVVGDAPRVALCKDRGRHRRVRLRGAEAGSGGAVRGHHDGAVALGL